MMQATKASRTLRRPGTVDRNPLISPGLALVSPTSIVYRMKARQEVTVAPICLPQSEQVKKMG